MDMVVSPALLAALLLVVSVIAWSAGRWQTNGAVPQDQAAPRLPTPGPAAADGAPAPARDREMARAADLLALESSLSLAELHDEISAFRQRERVFATVALDELRLDERPIRAKPPMESAYADLRAVPSPPKQCADYPSPGASAFTRV
jgi:hypothetical protein